MTRRDLETYVVEGDCEVLTSLADSLKDFTRVHEICETEWLCEKLIMQTDPAVRFALAEPRLSCVIFGLAELEHLEEALAAEEMGSLPEDALGKIRSIYHAPR